MNKRGERALGDARRAVGPGRECGMEGGSPRPGSKAGMGQVLLQGRLLRALRAARRSVLALAAGAAVAAMVSCAPQAPVFDPHTMDRTARVSAAEALPGTGQTRPPLPTSLQETSVTPPPQGVVDENTPVVRLTLQEVIQRTAANNKEARVAGYEPSIEETRLIEAEARFDPAFFLNSSYDIQRLLSPGTSLQQIQDPFQPREFRTLTGQAGIRQLLPTGAQAEASYRLQRIQSNELFEVAVGDDELSFHNYYLAEFQLRLTQPLLRDFGTEVNRARIAISRQNRRVSLLEFRRTLEEQLFEQERTYWQLVQAEREVQIQTALLERSIETYRILLSRFRAGVDVSRVQVSQASSFVEAQRAVLLRARAQVGNLSDQLKRFMNDPAYPVSGPVVVLAADAPMVEQVTFDLADAIDTAMDYRPELGQAVMRIRVAEITQEVGRNNLLPQLNFIGSLSFQGVGLDIGQAIKDQRQWEDISSSVGIELEIPIGNRAARAIFRRVQLQRLQAIEQYRNQMDLVQQEVKTSLRDVETSWLEIVQRRQARFAAADSLLAIRQRAEAGEALTPTFVQLSLDAQERLARAEAEESAAISNYNIAISRLERAKGTLLRYNNVLMAEEPLR